MDNNPYRVNINWRQNCRYNHTSRYKTNQPAFPYGWKYLLFTMICQSAPVLFNLKWCKLTVHPTNWCSIILCLMCLPFLGYFLILQIRPMKLQQAQQVPPSPFQISQCPPVVLLWRRGHTGNSGEKIDRTGEKKPPGLVMEFVWSEHGFLPVFTC